VFTPRGTNILSPGRKEAPWWASGDRDAALVLADRLQQLDAEQVAEALLQFRAAALQLPVPAEAARRAAETVVGGVGSFARALAPAAAERQENFPP